MAKRSAYLPFVRLKQINNFVKSSSNEKSRMIHNSTQAVSARDSVLQELFVDYFNSMECEGSRELGLFTVTVMYGLLREECFCREQVLPVVSQVGANSFLSNRKYTSLSGVVNAGLFELFDTFRAQNKYLADYLGVFNSEKSLLDRFQVLRPAIMTYSLLEAQAEINCLEESLR